jgi:SAM-dependent methyltransferase
MALRDAVRSSVLGLAVRNLLIRPYARIGRLRERSKLTVHGSPVYTCNICGYRGAFTSYAPRGGAKVGRVNALCVACGAAERHRLQKRVFDRIVQGIGPAQKSMLHFAPEVFFTRQFRTVFGSYTTADLFRRDADMKADISDMPVPNAYFDFVYASHVLEHVPDDRAAIREVYRILKPGGVAILPVPIYSDGATIEFGEARPDDDGHVRAPGLADYFDRYRAVFDKVNVYSSSDFLEEGHDNQLFVMLQPQADAQSEAREDYVPVCFKSPVAELS